MWTVLKFHRFLNFKLANNFIHLTASFSIMVSRLTLDLNTSNFLDQMEFLKDESIDDISIPRVLSDELTFLVDGSVVSDINNTADLNDTFEFGINCISRSGAEYDTDFTDLINNFQQLHKAVNNARMKYNRSKMVIDCMNELFNYSSILPKDIRETCCNKFRRIQFQARFQHIEHFAHFFRASDESNFCLKDIDLILTTLKNTLSSKCMQLKTENEIVSDMLRPKLDTLHVPGTLLTPEEATVLIRLEELARAINSCSDKATEVKRLTDAIYNFRSKNVRENEKLEISCLEGRTKLLHLQLKNLNFLIEKSVVEEFENITEATDIIYKELQISLNEEEYSLKRANLLKESYDEVRQCGKFDKILNQYKALRDNCKHKHWAMKQLKS